MSAVRDARQRGVDVKRRELLRMIGGAGAFWGAALLGLAPLGARLGAATRGALRAPADLLTRIRRRTRPLDERALGEGRDLAG